MVERNDMQAALECAHTLVIERGSLPEDWAEKLLMLQDNPVPLSRALALLRQNQLVKATVKQPGIRGGKWYRDDKGDVQYGIKPSARQWAPTPPVPVLLAQAVADGGWSAESRRHVEDLVAGRGYYRQPTSDDTATVGALPHSFGGVHSWSGAITISPSTEVAAQRFAKAWAADPKKAKQQMKDVVRLQDALTKVKKQVAGAVNKLLSARPSDWEAQYYKLQEPVNAIQKQLWSAGEMGAVIPHPGLALLSDARSFSTLLHEVYHGYGPLSAKAYEGTGAVTEEVTTEVLARRDMHEHFGVPRSHLRSKDYGAYEKWISHMLKSVRKTHGCSETRAWGILERASDKLKRSSEGGEDRTRLSEHFAMLFEPVGNDLKDKPRWSLLGTHPITGAEYDRTEGHYDMETALREALEVWSPKYEDDEEPPE